MFECEEGGRLWRRRKREAVRLMVKGSVICRVSGGVAVAACGAGAYFSKGESRGRLLRLVLVGSHA